MSNLEKYFADAQQAGCQPRTCSSPDVCPYCGEDERAVAAMRERFAAEMMARGLATGHGYSLADLHKEMWWQFDEIRQRQNDQAQPPAGADQPK